MVVSGAPLTPEQRDEVTSLLLDISGRRARRGPPARPVELTIVIQRELRPWRYPPKCELLYGEWLRDEIVDGTALEPFANPDLALVVTSVLACDVALFGPPAGDVLDPVPIEDLVAATVAGVPDLLEELGSDTTNVLLTLARAWRTTSVQDVVPKDVAAEWAIAGLPTPDQGALEHAKQVYLGVAAEDWGRFQPVLRSTASHLVARITAVASPA
ncbi:MAG TPA: aminoglycoside adenylyltransferase domain-containing protein [Trueperaceae bacterium]|nr:aminoglycoside adenylyltransferase domain-containing protein [Trueperaceae bacterium]